MVNYQWQGNIRQLKNITEQISIIETDREINVKTLTKYLPEIYHNELNDTKNSIYYYKRTMKILAPAVQQTSIASVMLAESQKKGGLYKEAIETYLSALKTSPDISLYMIIANLYDEKLKDPKNAIYYYNIFLEKLKTAKMNFKSDYIESISKRVVFLKEEQKKASAKPPQTKPK